MSHETKIGTKSEVNPSTDNSRGPRFNAAIEAAAAPDPCLCTKDLKGKTKEQVAKAMEVAKYELDVDRANYQRWKSADGKKHIGVIYNKDGKVTNAAETTPIVESDKKPEPKKPE